MICEHCGCTKRGSRGYYLSDTKGEQWKCPECCKFTKITRTKSKTLHQVTKMTREQAKELFKNCQSDFIVDKLYDYFTEPYTGR